MDFDGFFPKFPDLRLFPPKLFPPPSPDWGIFPFPSFFWVFFCVPAAPSIKSKDLIDLPNIPAGSKKYKFWRFLFKFNFFSPRSLPPNPAQRGNIPKKASKIHKSLEKSPNLSFFLNFFRRFLTGGAAGIRSIKKKYKKYKKIIWEFKSRLGIVNSRQKGKIKMK